MTREQEIENAIFESNPREYDNLGKSTKTIEKEDFDATCKSILNTYHDMTEEQKRAFRILFDCEQANFEPLPSLLNTLMDAKTYQDYGNLKKENEELKRKIEGLELVIQIDNRLEIEKREEQIAELKLQIERLKCCANCDFKINKGCEGTIWLGKEYCDKWNGVQ